MVRLVALFGVFLGYDLGCLSRLVTGIIVKLPFGMFAGLLHVRIFVVCHLILH